MRRQQQESTTIRRPFRAPPTQNTGPRSNKDIRVPQVQLIDAEGENRGPTATSEALAMAEEAGLVAASLVRIPPPAPLPSCSDEDRGETEPGTEEPDAGAAEEEEAGSNIYIRSEIIHADDERQTGRDDDADDDGESDDESLSSFVLRLGHFMAE